MLTTPIIQFGTSRFLQAHAALFVSEALQVSQAAGQITVVQSSGDPTRAKRLSALAAPDGYPVHIRGLKNGIPVDDVQRVTSVARTLSTATDWAELSRVFVDEAQFILSNTGDKGFDAQPADTNAEFDQRMSYPAKLTLLLKARFEAGAAPIQIMPLELIVQNGQVLKGRVRSIARNMEADFQRYLEKDVIWVDSLVDRIVSEPIEPAGAIAEPYALWAVENQTGLVLPCSHPAIQIVDRLDNVEALKLFVLNLGHTYLADKWREGNWDREATVLEMLDDKACLAGLKSIYIGEVLPSFAAAGLLQEAQSYVDTTLERFANPFLRHRVVDIAQNHAEKVERRITAFLNWAKTQGDCSEKPRLTALSHSLAL